METKSRFVRTYTCPSCGIIWSRYLSISRRAAVVKCAKCNITPDHADALISHREAEQLVTAPVGR